MPTRAERLSGGLIGLLVGDALGVPYEFRAPHELPSPELIEYEPPPRFRRSHPGAAVGAWSDDGAQALCLLASLLHCDRLDLRDFGNRLCNWHQVGYMAVNNHLFDIGIQTSEALNRLRAGTPPEESGGAEDWSQGNGSLMRVLPLALWHRGSDAELVRDAHQQSLPTHGHPTVQACCALYCLWARGLLEEAADPWGAAVATLRGLYRDQPVYLAALNDQIRPEEARTPGGCGFVIDSLFSARHALEARSYEAVVKAAIGLGNDTDTTACIAGGLAGVRDGVGAIPMRWRTGLAGWDEVAWLEAGLMGW
jgi:ADP-ribosyl-[dinitrogen reductase] hydrolase